MSSTLNLLRAIAVSPILCLALLALGADVHPHPKASLLACQTMVAPSCGVRSGPKAQQLSWPKRDLTWTLITEGPKGFTRDQTRTTIAQALEVWSNVCSLRFAEVADGADILVSFAAKSHAQAPQTAVEDPAFDGPGGVLAHAFYPGAGIGGDCHVDADERWSAAVGQGLLLRSTLIHEFGHSLGFDHDDVNPESIMWPTYTGGTELAAIDIKRAASRYGPTTQLLSASGELKPSKAEHQFASPKGPTKAAIEVSPGFTWTIRRKSGLPSASQAGRRSFSLPDAGPWIITVQGVGAYSVRVVTE